MRIGELASRTRTSRRLLRYYEEQGLLDPSRGENGYREYDERFVDRVAQIRGLLDAGLPIRLIQKLLPCLDTPGTIYCPDPTPEMIARLTLERDRLAARVSSMSRNLEAISSYLATARDGAEAATH